MLTETKRFDNLIRFIASQPIYGLAGVFIIGLAIAVLPLSWAAGVTVFALMLFAGVLFLERPIYLLAVAIWIGPLAAWESKLPIVGGLPLRLGQIALLAALIVWGLSWLGARRTRLPRFFIQPTLLIFIFISLLTLLQAESMSLGIKEVIKWLEMLFVIWMILDIADRDSEGEFLSGQASRVTAYRASANWLLAVLLLAGFGQALIGMVQFLRPDGPPSFLILGRFYRAFGTFEQPNPFAGFMALNALLAIGFVFGWAGQFLIGRLPLIEKRPNWISLGRFGFVLICAGACGLALIMSWSRGAWLGAAAGGAMIAFLLPHRRIWGVGIIIIGFAAAVLIWQGGYLPASLTDRISSSQEFQLENLRDIQLTDANYALLERLAFWQAAAGMAREHLWLGVGFGNYDAAYAEFAPEGWPQSLGHAHNFYLNLIAEVGVLGLVAYVVFWSAVFWQNLRLLRTLPFDRRGIALGLMGAWVALTVHHLVDKLYVNNMFVHIGVMLALQQLLAREARQLDHENTKLVPRKNI